MSYRKNLRIEVHDCKKFAILKEIKESTQVVHRERRSYNINLQRGSLKL